ncbi:patched [Pelagophyceae sp. CCMP2097]|nr:patched [Pelagophyceae sp. CCMP2097]
MGSKRPWRALARCSTAVDERVAKGCALVAFHVARRPWLTVVSCVAAAMLCGLGLLAAREENNAERLFTPQHTKAFRDRDWIESRFGDDASTSTLLLNRRHTDSDVLTKQALFEAFDLHDFITTTLKYDADNCEKVYWRLDVSDDSEFVCQKESVLAYWAYNRTLLEEDEDVLGTVSRTAADCCSPLSRTVIFDRVVAKPRYDESGNLVGAGALRSHYFLEQFLRGKKRVDSSVARLERAFDRRLRKQDHFDSFKRPKTLTAAGISKAITAAFDLDRFIVNGAAIAILLYPFFVLFEPRERAESRGMLGLWACAAVGLAVLAGFGIVLGAGVKFSPVQTLVIFLTLGIGLDDAFVIIGAETNLSTTIGQDAVALHVASRRAVVALAVAGPSITVTSLTDCAAFVAGEAPRSFTRIPAIRAFCLLSAACVACDYVLQITLFVSFFVFDIRGKARLAAKQARAAEKELKPARDDAQDADSDNARRAKAHAADETPPDDDDATRRRFWARYSAALLSMPGMALVIALLGVSWFVGVYGAARVTVDFKWDWFIPDGTPERAAADFDRRYWSGTRVTPADVYTKAADYYAEGETFREMLRNYAERRWVVKRGFVTSNWYVAHERWQRNEGLNVSSSAEYLSSLHTFLESPSGAAYSTFVVFSDDGNVSGTKINAFWKKADDGLQAKRWMQHSRKTLRKTPSLAPIVYGFNFVWLEAFEVILRQTLTSLAVSCAAVEVVLLVLLGNVWAATLVSWAVVLVCLLTYSAIYWYSQRLNPVSSFFIIIAVGLSTDASAHVAHAFLRASQPLRKRRAVAALMDLGPSVLRGGVSTLVGIAVVAASTTYVFRTFFFYLATILVTALIVGLVFMPVILSILGPGHTPTS